MTYNNESQEELAQSQFGSTDAAARASGMIPMEDVDAALRRIEEAMERKTVVGGMVLRPIIAEERERLELKI